MGKWTDLALKRKKQIEDALLEKDHIIAQKETELAAKVKQISDLQVVKK